MRAATDRPIFIGGHATQWSPGLAGELGVVAVGAGPAEVIATAQHLVGIEPGA